MDSFVFITNYFRLKLLLQLLKEQKKMQEEGYIFLQK